MILVATISRVQSSVVEYFVAVRTAGLGLEERGEIDVADSQIGQIIDDLGQIPKPKSLMKL